MLGCPVNHCIHGKADSEKHCALAAQWSSLAWREGNGKQQWLLGGMLKFQPGCLNHYGFSLQIFSSWRPNVSRLFCAHVQASLTTRLQRCRDTERYLW